LEVVENATVKLPPGLVKKSAQKLVHPIDHALAGVGSQLYDAGIHSDRVLGTSFDTEAAKDADAEIDIKHLRHFFDVGVRMFGRHDVNAARRADRLAHHAGYAARGTIFPPGQAVSRSKSLGKGASLFRILVGNRFALVYSEPQRA